VLSLILVNELEFDLEFGMSDIRLSEVNNICKGTLCDSCLVG
jgi:hypothetical protein